ncbi:EAL domain-containing protein [Photobacterium kagoshimensis]|uniref:EAL domain-containing protein n=1 Tax=Photobacterium kagoshimensis TaxID=2910242 RepID=UPI003D0DD784
MNKILRTVHDIEHYLRGTTSDGFSFVYQDKIIRSAFQPIVKQDKTIFGYEALMRVYDAEGLRFQTEPFFTSRQLPLFDKINIDRLARVIHLRNFAHFIRHGALFLNMSPDALVDNRDYKSGNNLLFPRVKELGLNLHDIYFELLEHHCTDDKRLNSVLCSMRGKGVKLAMDDYGSQASSEERARSVRPDIIKMDKSLLQEYLSGCPERLNDALKIAKVVGAKVLLEGVEDQQAYDIAISLGVDFMQGYYFGRPLLLHEFVEQSRLAE